MHSDISTWVRPKLLIFDLDNTLYPYDICHEPALEESLARIVNEFNCDAKSVKEAYLSARNATKKQLGEVASSHSRLLYFLRTFENLGFGPRPADALILEQVYWRNYLSRMTLVDGVLDLFNIVKANGIPLALATDLTAGIQIRKLIVLKIAESFDFVVTSEECVGEKTSGDTYNALLEKADIGPGPHLWMVGDSTADMLAKNHVGATTIYANFFGGSRPVEKPDVTITEISQLIRLIEDVCDANA